MNDVKAIAFANEGEASKINYSIPLPGSHVGRRIVELDLDLNSSDYRSQSKKSGTHLADRVGAVRSDDGEFILDDKKANAYVSGWLKRAVSSAENQFDPSEIVKIVEGLSADSDVDSDAVATTGTTEESLELQHLNAGPQYYSTENNFLIMPALTWSGSITTVRTPLDHKPEPRLFIVEKYGVSSFLGDYGMGKTVKTFTLLPGESTTISLKTWQSTKSSIKESSSIIDSHEKSARDRFADTVQKETTDKTTESETTGWNVAAEAKASWGWGSAKVSGGANGEYSSSREEFGRQASEAVQEHASEASSKRELSVSSSSEKTAESGSETLVERTIKNVNVRRALNFVFRELNQEYVTKLHLKDVRIAFSNGNPDSWEEVPISGLLRLLNKYVVPSKVNRTAKRILKAVGIVFDTKDKPVFTLDKITLKDGGASIHVEDATLGSDGEFPAPTENSYYRFKPGALEQEGESNPVDGVLMSSRPIVMRTDSVLVEALLGQADALDNYAMEVQEAAATKQTLMNSREKIIQESLNQITDPEERIKLLKLLTSTCCSDKGNE
jgi:hypothetical protein